MLDNVCRHVPFKLYAEVPTDRWLQVRNDKGKDKWRNTERNARQPICILRSKKIEQGQLLYPKIFPPIFFKVCQESSSNGSRLLKDCTVQMPPKPVKIRVLGFSMVQSSPIGLYIFSSIYMSSFKDCTVKPSPKAVNSKLGFWFFQGIWDFQWFNQVS